MFRLARGDGELADETALLNGGAGASPKSAARCLAGSFPTVCLCIVVVVLLAFVPQITSTNSSGWPALISSEKQKTTTTETTATTTAATTTTTTTSRPRTSLNNTATNRTRDTPHQLPSHAHLPIDLEHRSRRQRTIKSPSLLSPSTSKLETSDDYDDEAAWSAVSTSAPTGTDQVPTVAMVDSGLESADDEDSILRDEVEFQRRLIDQSHWPTSGSTSLSSSPAAANPTGSNRTLASKMGGGGGGELSAGPEPNLLAAFFSHIDKQWKFAEIVLIIVISAILNLVTIVGNIMVLISFKMDRSLQTVSNYFLLSLALADLLIGLISMPLYTLYLLLNYWPLGALMCDIWLAIDYLNSNAAVLNMLVISFDRYFSVTRPLTYRAKRTTKHAILMISFAWLLSLTIWTPAIFTYPYYKGRTVQGTDKCEIEFVKANTYLTFVTAILAFYIPVAIMIYLYWRIWLETKKRYRDLTTLFLVSGVGAAAPSRPTRPPPSSLPGASSVLAAACPSKSLAKSLGARFTGGAHSHAHAVGQSNQDRKLAGSVSRAGDSRVRLEPASDSRGRQRRDQLRLQGSDASNNNEPNSISNSSFGPRKEVAGPEVESTESGAAIKCAQASAPVTSDKQISSQSHNDKNQQQARGRVQSSCKLCPTAASAKHRSKGGGVQRANCCCCYSNAPQTGGTTTEVDANQKQQQQQRLQQTQLKTRSKTGAGHCHIPTCSCNCNCSGAPQADRVAASKHHHHHHHNHHHHHSRSTGGQQQADNVQEDEAETNPKYQTSGSKTSLYQLIAEAASSSHQRSKIHPEAPEASNSCGKELAETSDAHTTTTRPDGVQLADEMTEVGANNRNKTDTCQSRTTASGNECLLVDVATSPIHFLPSPADSKLQTHHSIGVGVTPLATPISPLSQSPEPEDFETRIVSHGDKFTFETNDPKLVSSAAKTFDAAHHNQVAERRRSGSKQRCCKWSSHHSNQRQQQLQQQQQQQTAKGSRCSNQDKPSGGSVHHQGKQSQCCCADMISVHDAECRFCQPTGRPEHQLLHHNHRSHNHNHANNHHHHHGHHHHHQHRHPKHQLSSGGHHHHHHNHNHNHHHHHHHQQHHSQYRGDCKRCLAQQKPPAQMTPEVVAAAAAAAADNRDQGEGLKQEVANEQGGSLPILNALQQKQPIESGLNNGQPNRPVKSGKKFSQKLTFSDILMERSNSCVTIESEQVAGGKSGGGGSSKSKSSSSSGSRQLAANYEEQAIQNIVKRNADRLRSAFDEDSDDQDGGQAAAATATATGRNKSVQPSLNPTSRGNWLKCFALDMFRSRNRPVRYRTDNYRGYRTDDEDEENDGEERDDRRPNEGDERAFGRPIVPTAGCLHWLRSLCGLGARLPIVKQTPTSSSSSSSSKNNIEERNSFQTQQHRVDSKGEHRGGSAGGASSQHSSTSSSKAQQCHHYHPIQPKSERKAAKTLSTLLLVFIVTWLPYNVLVLIKTLSGGEDQVPEKIWNFSYYLCYINSTINPLCYALCNAQFRRTYMRILKCKLSNEHNSTRRMVPIQSSSTWNKDLRLNSTSAADCSTNSTMSHPQHYQQHYLQQAARTAERQRPKAIQERDSKNISSSDSSAGYHQHNGHHRTG